MKHITHWIDGKPFIGDVERHGKVFDPSTGLHSGDVDFATVAEVDLAVAAAKAAFPEWRATSLASARPSCSRCVNWLWLTPVNWET